MSKEPSSKRRRTDDDTDNFTQSQDLWFSDGTLIVICESTGFRVHPGVLALHCGAFKDMLSVGDPSGDHVKDGAAVVKLGDTADEMALFLKTLYFREEGPMRARMVVDQLGSLLRLARKYLADRLEKEIMEHLTLLFPSTLNNYRSSRRASLIPSPFLPHDAVGIALDLNIPILLPMALYLSARMGSESEDREYPILKDAPSNVIRAIMVFRERYSRGIYERSLASKWLSMRDVCCSRHEDCAGFTKKVFYQTLERYRALEVDIFKKEGSRRLFLSGTGMVCEDCVQKFQPDAFTLRLWTSLPNCCMNHDWQTWSDVSSAQDTADGVPQVSVAAE
ncbi:hypothetical protein OF83DRAFT_253568 [Amylostereum chailletii]|nr:hypothetical protein OF83DRAFT_253568 [Amylostereum chailletii]